MRRGPLLLPLACAVLLAPTGRRGEPAADFDFRYDILPLLHRQGCGSAYCHGSATGRGGFKLSLFASDPHADFLAITRDLGGRRLDLQEPGNSLLLKKPSLQLRHGGGRKIRKDDAVHAALRDWIAAGAPYRHGAARELTDLTVRLVDNRLRASATFATSDGEVVRDVTDLCSFRSSDERVAAIDAEGRVTRDQPGEAWLFARYVNQSARLAIVQPFNSTAALPTVEHDLDGIWLARLEELGVQPAAPADAATLARRLYLDLADRLPNAMELAAFHKRPAETRIETTARRLMATRDFAVKFGRHLAEWLEIPLEPPARRSPRTGMFAAQHRKLVDDVAAEADLHTIAETRILRDRALLNRFADPRDRAELAGRAFLGIRIGCARCHDSPVDRWERKDHLAFSALFADPRPDQKGSMQPGVLFDPESRQPVEPRVLPVGSTALDPSETLRTENAHARAVAEFVVRGDHRMFERNIANRTFAALMGRGLVEPLDDHRMSNPAVHEPILAHLARIAHSGDLRELCLHIVTSRMYQASSTPKDDEPGGGAAVRLFARREARTMRPVTFQNAVAGALGVEPEERLPRSPLARQLALLNDDFLHRAVRDSRLLGDLIDFAPDDQARLAGLYSLLLSRQPRTDEIEALLPDVRDGAGIRDLAFALLASREFGSIR